MFSTCLVWLECAGGGWNVICGVSPFAEPLFGVQFEAVIYKPDAVLGRLKLRGASRSEVGGAIEAFMKNAAWGVRATKPLVPTGELKRACVRLGEDCGDIWWLKHLQLSHYRKL